MAFNIPPELHGTQYTVSSTFGFRINAMIVSVSAEAAIIGRSVHVTSSHDSGRACFGFSAAVGDGGLDHLNLTWHMSLLEAGCKQDPR